MPGSVYSYPSRGCSSVGSSERVRLPRRRLDPVEAPRSRVRPWCPAAGRGSPWHYAQPRGGFFSAERFGSSGGPGGEPLKGSSPPGPKNSVVVRARGADGGSADASAPPGSPGAVAAVEGRLRMAVGEGALRTLCRAEEIFAAGLGPPSAGPLVHLPSVRRLLWVLARLDRYGDMGRGQAGAGLSVLEGRVEGLAHALAWGETPRGGRPRHLGYFLPELEVTARRWKHTWAPRIKDRRIAEGRRARRRAPARPGRGPAIGFDPRKPRPRHAGRQSGRGQ
jgi:hypothetical protein